MDEIHRRNMLKHSVKFLLIPLMLFVADTGHTLSTHTDKLDLSCLQDVSVKELQCSYRMFSAEPVTDISASFAGKTLLIKQSETYPWNGAITAILILVDTSDPGRQNVIVENQKIIGQILLKAGAHDHIGLASFDKTLRLEAPVGAMQTEILAASGKLHAVGMTTELYRSVLSAIDILKKTPADRKSIYLLSDGLAEDKAYFHHDVVRAANANGIVINSLGFPRSVAQSVGLQTLRRLSEETGGIFVEADNNFHVPDIFMNRPFDSIDNGGKFTVDLSTLGQVDGKDRLTVDIGIITSVGSNHTDIPLAVSVPRQEAADKARTTSGTFIQPPVSTSQPPIKIITREVPAEPGYFWSWYLVLIGLIFLLILVITAFFLTVYRQGKKKTGAPTYAPGFVANKPYAYLVLQDESKKRHPITQTTWRIGRGSDNEMTLHDNSVSRRHAEIHRDKGDIFTIFDLDSLNGVFINDNKVHKQILHEGDIIDIGDISLRFTLLSNEYALEDSTVMQHTRTPLTH